jgi:hypothetical protein
VSQQLSLDSGQHPSRTETLAAHSLQKNESRLLCSLFCAICSMIVALGAAIPSVCVCMTTSIDQSFLAIADLSEPLQRFLQRFCYQHSPSRSFCYQHSPSRGSVTLSSLFSWHDMFCSVQQSRTESPSTTRHPQWM